MGITLEMKRLLPAPPERVFAALTEPELLKAWWGPAGFSSPHMEVDLRAGGSYRFAMQPPDGDLFHLLGEYTAVDPPARLAYTFRWEPADPDDRETQVTLELAGKGHRTELGLTQGDFKTEARRELHRDGWTDSLDRLEALLAAG